MIVIEDMPSDATHKNFAYAALFRAINSLNIPVFLWRSDMKNIFDIKDELNPDQIIYHSLSGELVQKVSVPKALNFNIWYENNPLISDPLMYRQMPVDEKLACETVCISPYKEDEFTDEFFKYMDIKTKRFRFFSQNNFGGHKSCGYLPENLHSLVLSSAKSVLVLSPQFEVNAVLVNDNILNPSVSRSEALSYSSLELIRTII